MVTLQLRDVGALHGRTLTISGISTPRFSGGEVVAVIGPNAAGKSTLFKRIAGLLKGPGELVLEGSRKGEGRNTAASPALTVCESVLLARKQQGSSWTVQHEDLSLIDETLASLGIRDIAFRQLGELSGGQRQLASIAQTLVRDPEILLMDDPTSALDLHRQMQVLAFTRELARRGGLLVFTAIHDLNQALRFSDQTLVLAGGRQHCCGACERVITAARAAPGLRRRGPHRTVFAGDSAGCCRCGEHDSRSRRPTTGVRGRGLRPARPLLRTSARAGKLRRMGSNRSSLQILSTVSVGESFENLRVALQGRHHHWAALDWSLVE
jgi:iron complex transport system ATP-binding protein